MAYVSRDGSGNISGVFANAQPDYATELLSDSDAAVLAFLAPKVPPPSFLARDLFGQLTVADYSAIKGAVASSDAMGLLWDSLKAQGDAPIATTSPRFQQGWAGLSQALGQARADEIAKALGIPSK